MEPVSIDNQLAILYILLAMKEMYWDQDGFVWNK